jgi:hypothetical protein
MKNAVIGLLSVIVLILVVLYVRRPVEREVIIEKQLGGAESSKQINDQEQVINKLKNRLSIKESELKNIREQLVLLQTASISTSVSGVTSLVAEEEVLNKKEESQDVQSIMEALMANGMIPGKDGARKPLSVQEKYSTLIDTLGLSGADEERFMALLGKKGIFLSSEQEKQIDADIKSLLGEDAYGKYQQYEETLPTRLFVDDVAVRLSEAGYPLSDEQAAAMLDIDPSLAKGIPLSYSPASITLSGDTSGGDVNELVNDAVDGTASDFDQVVAQSEKILNDEQLDVLDDYLDERFKEKEQSANMASELLPKLLNPEFLKNGGGKVQTSVMVVPSVNSGTEE